MSIDKKSELESRGFLVGKRDPNRNRAFLGMFMVAEPQETPCATDDASGGGEEFCIVGNNLNELVECAYQHLIES